MTKANGRPKSFDLSQLDIATPAEAGTVVELEHPITGQPIVGDDDLPWSITVRGEDSPTVLAYTRKTREDRALKARKARGDTILTAEEAEAEVVGRMIAATISWHGLTLDGEVLECNPKNMKRIYGDDRFTWIADQVLAGMRDRKRFFSKPSVS